MKLERRIFKAELRSADDGRRILGEAVVFNQRSEDLGGYVEIINPAAFDDCDMVDVRCLMNHSPNRVLGRTISKTLVLARTATGVNFACDPADTTYARDLAVSMGRGDIDQCSFMFCVPDGGSDWTQDKAAGLWVRTVNKIARLYDVSVVTFPAYTKTSSEIRSNADILSERQTAPPAPTSGGVEIVGTLRRNLENAYEQHAV